MSSRSLNKVTLVGNLTRDPELKYTPQGTAVCSFGVATNRSWTTKSGDTKEDVQFHRITAWQKLAELCANLLSKGRKIYLEGRITYRSFEGKDGVQRNITEIIMDDFILFDDRHRAADGAEEAPLPEEDSNIEEDIEVPDIAEGEGEESKSSKKKNDKEKIDPDDIPF